MYKSWLTILTINSWKAAPTSFLCFLLSCLFMTPCCKTCHVQIILWKPGIAAFRSVMYSTSNILTCLYVGLLFECAYLNILTNLNCYYCSLKLSAASWISRSSWDAWRMSKNCKNLKWPHQKSDNTSPRLTCKHQDIWPHYKELGSTCQWNSSQYAWQYCSEHLLLSLFIKQAE